MVRKIVTPFLREHNYPICAIEGNPHPFAIGVVTSLEVTGKFPTMLVENYFFASTLGHAGHQRLSFERTFCTYMEVDNVKIRKLPSIRHQGLCKGKALANQVSAYSGALVSEPSAAVVKTSLEITVNYSNDATLERAVRPHHEDLGVDFFIGHRHRP